MIPSPVLHFWSLGVEEQFYLFWPLLISLVTFRRKNPALKIFLLSLAVLISSFTFANWLLDRNQPWGFFSFPTRAWELILGALLASAAQGVAKLPRAIAGLAGAVGLLMVLFSGFTQSDPLKFPGTAALMPTIGALLIILAAPLRTLTLPSKIIAYKAVAVFRQDQLFALFVALAGACDSTSD